MTTHISGGPLRFLLAIALLAAIIIFQIPTARADSTNLVLMKTSLGYNGQYKWSSKIPIRITLSNSGTRPIAGTLKLTVRNHSSLNGTYLRPVTLEGGQTKQIVFPITGEFNNNNNMDLSYAEWIQNGAAAVKQPLPGSGVPADFLAGIFADKTTSSALLQTQPANKQGPAFASVQLSAEDIPTDAAYNSSLDALLVTKEQISLLTSEQKKWINEWTADGGMMIMVDKTSAATAWKKLNETVSQGKQARLPVTDNSYQLGEIASHIPGIDRPNLPLLILLFIVYIFLIGPILYYVLKKQKRQEWTWAAVPTAAFITALLIFGYGKWQHGNKVLQQSVDILHIKNNGTADVESASSFFVPSGGDYLMRINKPVNLFPVNENTNGQRDGKAAGTTVTLEPQKSTISFPNSSFWSLHKAFVTERMNNTGSFNASLQKGTNRITGTVRNNTIYSLHDVRLVYGGAFQSIPVLAPGAEVQVNLPIDNSQGKLPPFEKLPDVVKLLPSSLGTTDSQSLQSSEGRILNMAYNTASNSEENPSLQLFGWTDQYPYSVDMAGEAYSGYRLTLVESRIGFNGVGGTK